MGTKRSKDGYQFQHSWGPQPDGCLPAPFNQLSFFSTWSQTTRMTGMTFTSFYGTQFRERPAFKNDPRDGFSPAAKLIRSRAMSSSELA